MRLHHDEVRAAGATPTGWLLLTHGILGAGGNWRGIARRVVEQRPRWGIVLVDLRGHGRSPDGAAPHTVAACAADLVETIAATALPVVALAGHSFGGKVVLTARAAVPATQQTWLLDSSPGPHPGGRPGTQAVVDMLAALPSTFADREAFEAAVRAAGQPMAIAQWLALSLRPTTVADEPRQLRFDVPMIRTLMADYLALDLWPQAFAAAPGEVRMVIGGASDVISSDDRARLATPGCPIVVDEIAGAGHWLNADAPAAMIALLARELPRLPDE